MSYTEIHHDCDTWDCSCGKEDQPLPDSFFNLDTLVCSACGAVYDLELDGDTEGGFFYQIHEQEGKPTP